MARIFPTIRRVFRTVVSGDSDQTYDLGTSATTVDADATGSATRDVGAANAAHGGEHDGALTTPVGDSDAAIVEAVTGSATRDVGAANAAYGGEHDGALTTPVGDSDAAHGGEHDGALTTPAGTAAAALAARLVGSLARAVGSAAATITAGLSGSAVRPVGTGGASMAGRSTGVCVARPTAHTIQQGWHGSSNNNNDWINPANAYSDATADATITAQSTLTAAHGFDDRLKLHTFAIVGAIPSGWTRTRVDLKIRYGFDLAWIRVLGESRTLWQVRKANGDVVATLLNTTNAGTTRAMAEQTWDLTTAFAALTATEIEGLEVWLGCACNVDAGVGNNASFQVDGVKLEVTYTRTGIT